MSKRTCTLRPPAPLALLLLALFTGGCAESLSNDGSGSDGLSVFRDGLESDGRSGSAAGGTDDAAEAPAPERTPDDGAPEEAPAPERTPDDGAPEEAPGDAVAPPERTPEEQAIADCWSGCVSTAFPNLIACSDAGGDSEGCINAFNNEVYACADALCTDPAAPEAPTGEGDGAGDAGVLDFYEAAFCDSGVFLQTYGIGRDEALENCLLNEASNPDRGVVCTWNGEVLRDTCGPAEGVPAPASCEGWEPTVLDRAPEFIDETYWNADVMDCDGPAFRRFDARYDVWVGLVSCGTGYRFYLSETAEGPYLPAADGGGHGQDLCELIDPSFSIPNDDDITSGGCSACSIGFNYSFVAGEVFLRYTIGQRFVRTEALDWGPYQSSVVTCASGPLECNASGDIF